MESVLVFLSEHWLALTAALVNFVWVYLEYKASIWLWPVGIILPIFYIILSWEALFLGNILVNVYYFVTSIIGWVMWLRHRQEQTAAENDGGLITHVPLRSALLHVAILLGLAYPMYLLFDGHSSMPLADTLATLLSFLGMLYLSRKQIQHWLCWIVANSLSGYIFLMAGDQISAVVFAVNLVVSILGYLNWHRMMQKQAHSQVI